MVNKDMTELKAQMKATIYDKATCMLNSYTDILKETRHEINKTVGSNIDEIELLKRTDMFFNLALQRVDKEIAEAKQVDQMMQRPQGMPGQNPVGQNYPPVMPTRTSGESPCAKKAREAAEKIAKLESKIVEVEVEGKPSD